MSQTIESVAPRPISFEGIPDDMRAEWRRIQSLDDATLNAEFSKAVGMTAHNLCRLALFVRAKEERGHDLSEIKVGLLNYLRKIAYGQVLPEVVAELAGLPALKYVASLPLPNQKSCIDQESVVMAAGVGSNGLVDTRRRKLVDLSAAECRQVFADGRIRDEVEQMAYLRSQSSRHYANGCTPEPPPYSIQGRRLVVIRPVVLAKRDLQNIIKSME